MIKKIFNKIKKIFIPSRQGTEDCDHENNATRKIKYCLDCNKVIQEY